MSFINRHRDDSGFDEAWRAFVEDDARLQAPAHLEARVINAAVTSQPAGRWHLRRRMIQAASLAAILLLTTMVLVRDQRGNDRPSSMPTAHQPAPAQVAPPLSAVPIGSASRATVSETGESASRARSTRRSPARQPLPPVLMTLGASPVRDTEALQLVRLRLPREALQGLGIVLLEPDAAGIVDVDVLIGEDGLARDIRQVRTGGEHP